MTGAAIAQAPARCRRYRRRILEISQQVTALHIGPAFSACELTDAAMNILMQPGDTFIMSKGHGWAIQMVILEEHGILSRADLDAYCTPGGLLGVHPDLHVPGIAAATGSLGHGLPMAVGMALADREHMVYVVMSDGELFEGSSVEAMLQASSFKLQNLIVFVDNNDYCSLGKISETHPTFYPLAEKFRAYGWEAEVDDGHKTKQFISTFHRRNGGRPFALIGKTIKGRGVSFMEGVPLWHYRSPNPAELALAMKELV